MREGEYFATGSIVSISFLRLQVVLLGWICGGISICFALPCAFDFLDSAFGPS